MGQCTSCLFIGENCEWEVELLGKIVKCLKLEFWKPFYFCLEGDGFSAGTVGRTFFTFLHFFSTEFGKTQVRRMHQGS